MRAPEENWRRTDPDIFFLPQEELLNFAGNPVVHTAGKSLVPWKVSFLDQTRVASFFPMLSKYILDSGVESLKSEMHRLIFVSVASGSAHVFVSESLRSSVEFQSSPWEARSTDPQSKMGLKLSQQLKLCSPHEFVITLNGKGNEVPLIVICNEVDPNFAQSFSKIKLILEKNSKAHLAWFEGGAAFSMHHHEIVLQDHAELMQVLGYQNERANSVLFERCVTLKENAKWIEAQIFSCSQGNMRMTSNVTLDGIRSMSETGSIVVSTGGKFDYVPIQHHKKPQTKSHLKLKMLLSKRGRSIFEGLVLVDQEAQKSQAVQDNKNLLLSSNARVDATPRLEILPNDVSCKHGSATGELDEKQLYYLTSRGFSVEQARHLLVHSFSLEALSKVEEQPVLFALAQNMLERALSYDVL